MFSRPRELQHLLNITFSFQPGNRIWKGKFRMKLLYNSESVNGLSFFSSHIEYELYMGTANHYNLENELCVWK